MIDADDSHRSPEDVKFRIDRLIHDLLQKFHNRILYKPTDDIKNECGYVLIIAHGHILRAFAMRWAGKTLQDGPAFLLEAGGVGTLR